MPSIVVLASEFPPGPGGIGTHAHHVALQLHLRGWSVSVAAPQELAVDERISSFNAELPFKIHTIHRFGVGPLKVAHRLARVSSILRRERPDLILASGERMVWIAAALASAHGVPFAAVGHAMEFNRIPRWEYGLTKRSFEHACGTICVSNYTRSRMDACDIVPRALAVIPNGADADQFAPIERSEAEDFRRLHGLEHASILITVGSVHERKGQDVVIRALPHVIESVPDVHYVIAGTPYRRDEFMRLARSLGVDDRVHFLGAIDHRELLRALGAANLFVMASQHTSQGDFEGFGIAVLEAALCGRAAVVSGQSGVVEAIDPGESGLVAVMGDPVSTAEKIAELLNDPSRLGSMEQVARTRALTRTWAHRGEQYDAFLRGLLRKN